MAENRRPTPHGVRIIRVAIDGSSCACGCLEHVSKGAKFRPGHDARLKSLLVRTQRDGESIWTEHHEWGDVGAALGRDSRYEWVFGYNHQYLNCKYTPEEYGRSVFSEYGHAALLIAMFPEGDE